jgi:L-histidine N-alpha-methyltransferase
MRLRSTRAQTVRLRALDLEVEFAAGEEMRTEVSAKFTRARVDAELRAAGMRLVEWWTDPAGDFALSLARRA